MKILQVSAHFHPNLGGVETHLLDLVKALAKRGHNIFVLTYQPLTTNVKWKIFEGENRQAVLRIPYLPGLFYNLVKSPLLEFLYLSPGLFFLLPFVVIYFNPDVIQSHGLVAGAVSVFWGKIFSKKVIISLHSIYNFPRNGLYRAFVKVIFRGTDNIVCLSNKSAKEIELLGIRKNKIGVFTYWVDLEKFSRESKAKEKLDWKEKFIVFFVGRLIPEKGIIELLNAAKIWNKNITLVVAGDGPLANYVKHQAREIRNLIFLGKIDNNQLPIYYSAADLSICPSIHEEGFGRVILESLACGTPVIASRRGSISEVIDETVGKLIDITPNNIKEVVENFYSHPKLLNGVSRNTRRFAVKRYAERNIEQIIKNY